MMVPMYWFFALVAVIVVGLVFLAYQGRLGGMPPMVDDRPGPDLPRHELSANDVRKARFAVVMRGYAMSQVDAVMDRLADQMEGRGYQRDDDYEIWAGEDESAAGAEVGEEAQLGADGDVTPPARARAVSAPAVVGQNAPLGWPQDVPVRA